MALQENVRKESLLKSNSNCLAHLLICLVAVWPLSAQESKGGIQLEVVPQTLEIASCQTGSPLLVIARNSTSQTAPALEVTTLSDAALTLLPPPQPVALAPQRQTYWQFQVTCQSGFTAGNLQIVLRSNPSVQSGPVAIEIETKSIPVKLRDPLPLENIASVEVHSTLASLHSGDTGELTVAITNKTAEPLGVTVTPKAARFFTFGLPPPAEPHKDAVTSPQASSIISPLSTGAVTFTVSANGQVTPGKQILLFDVALGKGAQSRSFLVAREVDVNVMGASEILTAVGVPSLFLLPGFLAVSAFLLLWRWNVLRPTPAGPSPLEFPKPDFWVVSVTVSMLITGCFLVFLRKDYFSYYGLGDLMTIWFTSIGLGSAAYVLYRGVALIIARWHYPQPRDSQITILHKLKHYGKTMDLPTVKLKGSKESLFLLLSEADSVYVCPQMLVTWRANADSKVQLAVESQLTKGGDPEVVAQVLQRECDKEKKAPGSSNIQELKWNGTDPLHPSAHKITAADIDPGSQATDIILEQKVG